MQSVPIVVADLCSVGACLSFIQSKKLHRINFGVFGLSSLALSWRANALRGQDREQRQYVRQTRRIVDFGLVFFTFLLGRTGENNLSDLFVPIGFALSSLFGRLLWSSAKSSTYRWLKQLSYSFYRFCLLYPRLQ